MLDPVVGWIARAALVVLFGTAAWHKARDLAAFVETVRAYRLVPQRLASPAALALVLLEISTGGVLLLPGLDPLGPALALLLLSTYSLAIGVNLARGRRDIDCGCLGPANGARLSPRLLVRNAVFACAPALLFAQASPRALSWFDALTVVGGTVTAVLLFTALDTLGAAGARATRGARTAGSTA